MIKKIIISPPFGNYIERDWATSVKGTYTLQRRSGALLQAVRTIRPIKGGWFNQIGLRNPGIKSINEFNPDHIYSIAAVETSDEWYRLYDIIPEHTQLELNAGCPSVQFRPGIPNTLFRLASQKYPLVILKIPPTEAGLLLIYRAYDHGVRFFHLSNTLPNNGAGGISGHQLKIHNLSLIGKLRERYCSCTDIRIIAGGGIYNTTDVDHYRLKDVDFFSLATIWFTPWKVKKVRRYILGPNY